MSLNPLDVRILKFIKSKKQAVKAEVIKNKLGDWCDEHLTKLYKLEYISCPLYSGEGQYGVPIYDDWEITTKGLNALANSKTEKWLTRKEAIIREIIAFVVGVLSSLTAQLIINLCA